MASDKRSIGDYWRPPGVAVWNALMDVADWWLRLRKVGHDPPKYDPPTDTVKLKNLTGGNLAAGRVVEIGDTLTTTPTRSHLWFEGNTPAPDADLIIAISHRAMPANAIDDCQVSGTVPARLIVNNIDHAYADAVAGSTILESATSGRAKILWKEDTEATGEMESVVLLQCCGAGGGDPDPDDSTPCLDPCPCCQVDEVTSFKVVIANLIGDSECCELLNGEFILLRDTEIGGCRWILCEEEFCEDDEENLLDLKMVLTLFGDDPKVKCECSILSLEISLVDPLTGLKKFYIQFVKETEIVEDCCLISQFLEMTCEPSGLCTFDEENVPTAQVCAICDPLDCDTCAGTQPRYMVLDVSGIAFGQCGQAELLNTIHSLSLLEETECTWGETERVIDECTAQFRLTANSGGIGIQWELTLTTSHDGDPEEVAVWTGESLTCEVENLTLTLVEVDLPDDVDLSEAVLTITGSTDACVPAPCCDEGDQVPLLMTILAECGDAGFDGESHEMEPDPGIEVHHAWTVMEDWFVCDDGPMNFRARLVCTDGLYRLTFFGTGTTSGCSKSDVTLTPTSVQCDPLEIRFETSIFNTGTPIDCGCCNESLPLDVEIVITLADGPLAAEQLDPRGVDAIAMETIAAAEDGDPPNFGLVQPYVGGESFGVPIPAYYNWFRKDGAALPINAGDQVRIIFDTTKGKAESQRWGIRWADSECE